MSVGWKELENNLLPCETRPALKILYIHAVSHNNLIPLMAGIISTEFNLYVMVWIQMCFFDVCGQTGPFSMDVINCTRSLEL